MSSEKIIEIFLKDFLRFFIPGVVFLIFALLLPAYLVKFLFPRSNIMPFLDEILSIITNPLLFVLIAISIGILLDLLKFHSIWTKIICKNDASSWSALKRGIVEATGSIIIDKEKYRDDERGKSFSLPALIKGILSSFITLSNKMFKKVYTFFTGKKIDNVEYNKDEEYKKNIKDLAFQIHSLYVKTKHPEIDQKIENSRIYPDILSMTLSSGLIGMGFIFCTMVLKISDDCQPRDWIRLILMIGLTFFAFLIARKKVIEEYYKLYELTKCYIKEAFSDDSLEKGGINNESLTGSQNDKKFACQDGNNCWKVAVKRPNSITFKEKARVNGGFYSSLKDKKLIYKDGDSWKVSEKRPSKE